jgi:alpha/beta superfamily hydrolase
MNRETELRFRADEIELEGRIFLPDGATAGCVVCHPHPLYGGNMHNNVVRGVADALAEAGIATLRFNFRGVAGSGGAHAGGIGEVADVRAAVGTLAVAAGLTSVSLAGYSFGSMVTLGFAREEAAASISLLDRVVAIAPPLVMFDASFAARLPFPLLLLAGDRDEYCPKPDFENLAARLGPLGESFIVEGCDHFFSGREAEIGGRVARFLGATGRA